MPGLGGIHILTEGGLTIPYKSKRQAAFIHAEAERGTPWAKKFVQDAAGTHVQKSPRKKSPSLPEQIASHLTKSGKLRGNR